MHCNLDVCISQLHLVLVTWNYNISFYWLLESWKTGDRSFPLGYLSYTEDGVESVVHACMIVPPTLLCMANI